MQPRGRPLAGIHHPLFVLGILMAAIGLGSLAAALADPADTQWPGSGYERPTRQAGDLQPAGQRSRFARAALEQPSCRPIRDACTSRRPGGAVLASRPAAEGSPIRSRPGEDEIFLHASAAVARGHVWVQEYVATPPAADFEMIAATSPNP